MPYKDKQKRKEYQLAYNAEYRKTDKNKASQKLYHAKKFQEGICRICTLPIFKGNLCEKHYHHNLERLAKHTKTKTDFVREIKLRYGCVNPNCAWKSSFYLLNFNFIIWNPLPN